MSDLEYYVGISKDSDGWCFTLRDGWRSKKYPNRAALLKHQKEIYEEMEEYFRTKSLAS